MPLGWDHIKNLQTEPLARAAINKMLLSKARDLAAGATIHKAAPVLQTYLHSIFYQVDFDREMQLYAKEHLKIAIPVQYAPGFVSSWSCHPTYPMYDPTTNAPAFPGNNGSRRVYTNTGPLNSQGTNSRLQPGNRASLCANMVMQEPYYRNVRELSTTTIDAVWSALGEKHVLLPVDGQVPLGAQPRSVIVTAADEALGSAADVAFFTTRFVWSLEMVRCVADVIIFADLTVSDAVAEAAVAITASLRHVRVFVLPVDEFFQPRKATSASEWRYALWASFLSRHQLAYLHSLHVHDVQAQFHLDPFRAIDVRGGLAVFAYRLIPQALSLSPKFMEAHFGHCWPDIYSLQKYTVIDDPDSPGDPGYPPYEPAIPKGQRKVNFPKYFWGAAQVLAGFGLGTIEAHLNFLVLVNNGLARDRSDACTLENYVQRMIWNFDVGISFPLTVYNPNGGPVRVAPGSASDGHGQARASSTHDGDGHMPTVTVSIPGLGDY